MKVEPEVLLCVIGAVILFFNISIGAFIGLGLIAWGVFYWYNSGKYSR